MGRWHVWGRGRFAILLSQAGGQLKRARSRVSLRDDSQPPHRLQPPGKSQTRRAPTKDYSPRHAEREDAAGDGVKIVPHAGGLDKGRRPNFLKLHFRWIGVI